MLGGSGEEIELRCQENACRPVVNYGFLPSSNAQRLRRRNLQGVQWDRGVKPPRGEGSFIMGTR